MDNLKVNFVSKASIQLASHRMRVLKPAELLNTKTDNIVVGISDRCDPEAHVNIFSKHFDVESSLLDIRKHKDKTIRVFDICDDHFGRDAGKYYEVMASEADHIVCNTKNMQKRIQEVTGKIASIIPDPITFPFSLPTIPQRELPNFIWFGHSSNIHALVPWLNHVNNRVVVVCDTTVQHPIVDSYEWKPMLVEKLIKDCDIVLIPTTKKPWSKTKSPNRVVDSLMAGKFVITDDEDIYGEFREFITIVKTGKDVEKAIDFWKKNPLKVVEMIDEGQKYVIKKYTDESILDGWLEVFKKVGVVSKYEKIKT